MKRNLSLVTFIFTTFFYSQTISLIDEGTKAPTNYFKVQKWEDGSVMNDSKVDGNIYIKKDGYYYKRQFEVYDVRIFGADKNKQDNTIYFNKAIDYLSKIGGGELLVPEGTWYANILIKSNIKITGSGINSTILKSPANSNKDVIKSFEFDALTNMVKNKPDKRGVRNVTLQSFSIDGNKQKNSTGCGIKIWGSSLIFSDIVVANCANDGIYTEFSTHGSPANDFSATNEALESNFYHIKTIANNGNGWTYDGPHDSEINDFVTFRNGGWGLYQKSGSLNGTHWNSWLNANSFYFGSVVNLDNVVASGEKGIGIEFSYIPALSKLSNILIGGHKQGLILRGNYNRINGSITDVDVAIINEGARFSNLDFTMYNIGKIYQENTPGAFNFYKILAYQGKGQIIKDGGWYPNDNEMTQVVVYNSDTKEVTQINSHINDKFWKNGWQPELPNSNGTIVATDGKIDTLKDSSNESLKNKLNEIIQKLNLNMWK